METTPKVPKFYTPNREHASEKHSPEIDAIIYEILSAMEYDLLLQIMNI